MEYRYTCKEVDGWLGEKEFVAVEWYESIDVDTYDTVNMPTFSGRTPEELVKELRQAADDIEKNGADLSDGESYKYKAVLFINGSRTIADVRNYAEVTDLVGELLEEVREQFYPKR
jgi:hypothetical protein